MKETGGQPYHDIAVLLAERRFSEAGAHVASRLASEPDDAELHNLAGICEARLGRGAEAEKCWQRAIALNPALAQPHVNLGLLYVSAGRSAEAERAFRQAIGRDPGNAEALFNLGTLLLAHSPGESERCLLEVIRRTPQRAAAYANLAYLCKKQRRLDEAERYYRQALAQDASSIDARFNLATFLADSSRPEDRNEARSLFLGILEEAPRHFGAWSNLGKLSFESGHVSAAKTAYTAAVTHHPQQIMARVNLGNVMLHLDELDDAKAQFSAALALDPRLAAAHQGLAAALQRQGHEQLAAFHRDRGFRDDPLSVLDYRGRGAPVPLLVLASATGGNVPWSVLIDQRLFQATIVAVEYFDRASPLPAHDLVFNAVGDLDLCPDALALARDLVARSDAPVLNHPDAVHGTGRTDIARRLSMLAGVTSPRMAFFPKRELGSSDAAERLLRRGFDFPLLLRAPGYHGGHFFERVDKPQALAAALDGLPGERLLVIEFLDGGRADRLFRKFRVMSIDGALYPMHMALSADWKVHYFSSGMAESQSHRDEEAGFLSRFESYLGSQAVSGLEAISRNIGLDYFGIDFGLDADGNVLAYEANATMTITPVTDDPMWDYRREAIGCALAAARKMFRDQLRRGDGPRPI